MEIFLIRVYATTILGHLTLLRFDPRSFQTVQSAINDIVKHVRAVYSELLPVSQQRRVGDLWALGGFLTDSC